MSKLVDENVERAGRGSSPKAGVRSENETGRRSLAARTTGDRVLACGVSMVQSETKLPPLRLGNLPCDRVRTDFPRPFRTRTRNPRPADRLSSEMAST
jgi:hypothetical protein